MKKISLARGSDSEIGVLENIDNVAHNSQTLLSR